jgi:hypothetical protein
LAISSIKNIGIKDASLKLFEKNSLTCER